eukprot:15360409-Alexandrium_andersonii.AAC.1
MAKKTTMKSAIRPMLVSAATRLNPQPALRSMHNCFKLSEPELRGPRNGLEIGPRNSRGINSASSFF